MYHLNHFVCNAFETWRQSQNKQQSLSISSESIISLYLIINDNNLFMVSQNIFTYKYQPTNNANNAEVPS